MDTSFFLDFISEIAYFLIVFGFLFGFSIFKGRQAIINLIVALYLALLVSVEFDWKIAVEVDTFAANRFVWFRVDFDIEVAWLA